MEEAELQLADNEPGKPPSCLIRGHRVRVHVDEALQGALSGKA